MSRPQAILIAGPTASGKSGFAAALARARNGVVINADSMQVYAELHVLTARPLDWEMAVVPHRLYGHVPGAEGYSVGRWLADVAAVLQEAEAARLLPVIVGGTGLYFKALTEGLSPVPAIPPETRAHWRREVERLGPETAHELLRKRDPRMADQLRPTDPQRIARALEVVDATGRSLADWRNLSPGDPLLPFGRTRAVVIDRPRAELHERCAARFDWMMANGALDEVAALRDQGLSSELPVMRALGVGPLLQLLGGSMDLGDAVAAGKAETRRYVKRQTTWLRRNMRSWITLDAQQMERELDKNFPFIDD